VAILKTLINNIYDPMLRAIKDDKNEWKKCEKEAQNEFQQTFDKFAKELDEAQESFKSNIVLEALSDKQRQGLRDGKTNDIALINEYAAIFSLWQDKINAYIDETNSEQRHEKDDGPAKELEYWKQRMRRLTQVSE